MVCKQLVLLINYFFALFLHELAHLFVAVKRGYKLKYFSANMFGFSISLDEAIQDRDNFAINIAGPMMNLTLSLLCSVLFICVPASYPILCQFFVANLVLAFFNLLPIYPLDGGKIFKGIFKTEKAYRRADKIVRCCLIVIFAIMFICSIFKECNWFFLSFTVFFACAKPDESPNFKLFKHKQAKFQKIVILKADAQDSLFDLLKHIDNKHFTIFYCADCIKQYFDEDSVVALSLKYPLTTKLNQF